VVDAPHHTQKDCRSFIEVCLERGRPVELDVMVDAGKLGRIHSGCTCDKGRRGSFLSRFPHFVPTLLLRPRIHQCVLLSDLAGFHLTFG
jgi:hypothetical protein